MIDSKEVVVVGDQNSIIVHYEYRSCHLTGLNPTDALLDDRQMCHKMPVKSAPISNGSSVH